MTYRSCDGNQVDFLIILAKMSVGCDGLFLIKALYLKFYGYNFAIVKNL